MKFNIKVISNIIGILLLINGFLMLTAVPFGIYHEESSWKGILVSALLNSAIGFFLYYRTKDNENKELKRRDGYLIVTSSWIFMSLFGMLPYIITGQISNVPDAFFETVSGYTTTEPIEVIKSTPIRVITIEPKENITTYNIINARIFVTTLCGTFELLNLNVKTPC